MEHENYCYHALMSETYEQLQLRIYIIQRMLADYSEYPPFSDARQHWMSAIEVLELVILDKEFTERIETRRRQ